MIFPESTTQSLYCCLVCLSQMLLLCRILSLVHTQLLPTCQSQYIVIVMKTLTLVGQALSSHNVIVSVQVNTIIDTRGEYPAYFSPRRQYRDCVVGSGNIMTLMMLKINCMWIMCYSGGTPLYRGHCPLFRGCPLLGGFSEKVE